MASISSSMDPINNNMGKAITNNNVGQFFHSCTIKGIIQININT
jgi:5,10-methylene-tetrahydrofolate dehydrogenase/methenyl tetrahydrofolate cyclohydrolase